MQCSLSQHNPLGTRRIYDQCIVVELGMNNIFGTLRNPEIFKR